MDLAEIYMIIPTKIYIVTIIIYSWLCLTAGWWWTTRVSWC